MSPTASRVYRTAAALSLTFYISFASILAHQPIPFLKQILFVGVLAAALTFVAMEYFLFHLDDSPAWKQILWFCALLFPPLGPALYCFLVYSHSNELRKVCSTALEGISRLNNSRPID